MTSLRAALAASLALVAVLGSGAGQQRHTEALPEQSCKCNLQRVGQCFTVRGRLFLSRSAPTARISIIGTRRVLGLKEGVPEWLEEDLEVPGNAVIGDFLVCPFTRRRTGVMQLVCIESGSNLVVTPKNP